MKKAARRMPRTSSIETPIRIAAPAPANTHWRTAKWKGSPTFIRAAAAGLAVANGIVVDGHLRTADPRIFAIGDCASFPLDGRATRLESVQAAADHARHVARSIAGQDQPYAAADGVAVVAVPRREPVQVVRPQIEQLGERLQIRRGELGQRDVAARGEPERGGGRDRQLLLRHRGVESGADHRHVERCRARLQAWLP